MSLEKHLCVKEWSHYGPFQTHEWRGTKTIWWRARNVPERQEKQTLYYFIWKFTFSFLFKQVSCLQARRFCAKRPNSKPWIERATFLTMNSVVSPCSYAVFQWRHKISVLVFWAFFCCIFIKRKMKLLKGSVHTYPNIFETIFFSVLSLLPSTITRLFQAPKMYVRFVIRFHSVDFFFFSFFSSCFYLQNAFLSFFHEKGGFSWNEMMSYILQGRYRNFINKRHLWDYINLKCVFPH